MARGTETVTILRPGAEDQFGQPGPDDAPRDVPQCIVFPRTSTEDHDRGEVVITGLGVAMPPGTDIKATDRVVARGQTWEVEGQPGDYRSKGGRAKNILVFLKTGGV